MEKEKTTRRLYYEDSHQREFDGEVLACETEGEAFQVLLDQTAFFPEGGGQYADTGVLNGVRVLDVKDRKGMIWHKTEGPLEPGTRVHGIIDWEQRFDRMQQHTGEHIVSGLVHQRFGYDNVGFHLGEDYCTMDFSGPITREELKEIEREANRAVFADLPVTVFYPSKEELEDLEYRSKIEIQGQVRLVSIPGYDLCACCAPHMAHTGEIGLIKLVNMINYKGGQRVTLLAGMRALKDYEEKGAGTKAISALLCAKEDQVAQAVEHLKEEQAALKQRQVALQRKLLRYLAQEILPEEPVTAVFPEDLEGDAPRELMNLVVERGANVCAVFVKTREGFRYVIGSREEDVRPLCRQLNEKFAGRGGGKPEMVQGSLTAGEKEEICAFCRDYTGA